VDRELYGKCRPDTHADRDADTNADTHADAYTTANFDSRS
jgi:hypothetical protein